jgi:phage shock protein E
MDTRLAALVAALAVTSTVACASEAPRARAAAPPAAGSPSPGIVDGATAQRLVAEGARLVDVRTPEEFAEGHARGAVNIPFDQMGARAAELGAPDTRVVVYCRSGRRSGIAAEKLRELGYRSVWDFQRFDAWPGPTEK